MSKEGLRKFYEDLGRNANMQKELISLKKEHITGKISPKDATNFIKYQLIPFAKKHGFEFSTQECASSQFGEENTQDLSEDELAAISGGANLVKSLISGALGLTVAFGPMIGSMSQALPRANSSPNIFELLADAKEDPWSPEDPYEKPKESTRASLRILARELGYQQVGSKKVIDLSYPSLRSYAKRLTIKEGLDTEKRANLSLKIDTIDSLKDARLKEFALKELFNCTKLQRPDSGDQERFGKTAMQNFEDCLDKLVNNFTGEQGIKSVLLLQHLIDNEIGPLGTSNLKNKKISIDRGWGGSMYDPSDHSIHLGKRATSLIYLSHSEEDSVDSHDISAAILHELTHACHCMLIDMSLKWANHASNTFLIKSALRDRLNPLLNKDVFDSVYNQILTNEQLKSYVCSIDEASVANVSTPMDFKEVSLLLGNNLEDVAMPEQYNSLSPEEKVRTWLLTVTENTMDAWTNAEEMLDSVYRKNLL